MRKVLIANRGEIAVRVIRACRDAGLGSVAVYAEPDLDAPAHPAGRRGLRAGRARPPPRPTWTSTRSSRSPLESGADAVHPGYGFLAENADFARAVIAAGLTWIGPPPEAIEALGDKVQARHIAREVGAPLTPGTADPVAGAGGGRGVRRASTACPSRSRPRSAAAGAACKVARTQEEIPDLYESAVREAVAAFGRGECFVERYLDRPRHVETQCLADAHGNVVIVSTRDCSLQRRHQKLVEEAPAPFLTGEQDRAPVRVLQGHPARGPATRAPAPASSSSARTARSSFLEVNTRLQVEHPVSEEVTGVDLVREMFRIAEGAAARLRRPAAPAGTRSSSGSTPRTRPATSCPRRAPSPPGSRRPGPASGWTPATRPG